MNWPMSQDYNEAVQNPAQAFTDADLQSGQAAVGPLGVPLPRSGNFADVYQLRCSDGRNWAVKCFTRPVVGLDNRYAKVSETLARLKFPFTIGFSFLAEGIHVANVWRPVVKMEWVEGLLLHQVARENANRPQILASLGQLWVKLCRRLREAGIAHADLQHGNVLLVPSSRAGAYELKLIDYDGMYVPSLANTPTGELGHSAYQHPSRSAASYSPDLDRFPHLVVATALKGLEVRGAELWAKYDRSDHLLFIDKDFQDPASSKLMQELWKTGKGDLQALVGRLAIACRQPIPQTPWLDEIAPDGAPIPLDREAAKDAEIALGLRSPAVSSAPPKPKSGKPAPISTPVVMPLPPLPPEPIHQGPLPVLKASLHQEELLRFDDDDEVAEAKIVEDGGKSSPLMLWAIAGVLTVVAVVGVVIIASSIKRGDSNSPVQHVQDDGTTQTAANVNKEHSKVTPVVPPSKQKEVIKPKQEDPKTTIDPKPPDMEIKPKDTPPPVVPELSKISPRWITTVKTEGSPARLYIDDASQTIILGSDRSKLMSLDPGNGMNRQLEFAWFGLTRGNSFIPLADGRVAKCAPDDTEVMTWEGKTGKLTEKYPVPAIPGDAKGTHRFVQISPNARYLVVGRVANTSGERGPLPFQIFDTKNKKADTPALVTNEWAGGSTYFAANSTRVLVAEESGRFRWFKLPDGAVDGEWDYGPPGPNQLHEVTSVSADGRVIGYNGPAKPAADPGPCLLDGKTGEVLHRLGGKYKASSPVMLSADGHYAAVLLSLKEKEAIIDVLMVSTGEPIARATVPVNGTPPTFTLSTKGDQLLVHEPKEGKLSLFPVPVSAVSAVEKRTYLVTLEHFDVKVNDRFFSVNGTGGNRGTKIKYKGAFAPHSIYLCPPDRTYSQISYTLGGKWTAFRADIGIPSTEENNPNPDSPLTFEVLADGKSIWKSEPVKKLDEFQTCTVNVENVKTLTLRVHCPDSAGWGWAFWLEPILVE